MELIVVLCILGVLIAIILPNVNGFIYDSKLNGDKAVASDLQNAIDVWCTLDKSDLDTRNYSYLSNTVKIGSMSEVQYYNKYSGTSQLPGTEFTNETDIRKAVLSSMKSVLGNSLIIDTSNWTIESPKTSVLLSYRYYYRTGIVKVVEFAEEEKGTDELNSYYITLDKVGYSNIATKGFAKVKEEKEAEGIKTEGIELYGLDVSALGIEKGLVEIWNLSINEKTTLSITDLQNGNYIDKGLYYIEGNVGDTTETIGSLLVITGDLNKCYSFELFTNCSSSYMQNIKAEINTDKDKTLTVDELKAFINADEEEVSKKYITSANGIEREVVKLDSMYIIS